MAKTLYIQLAPIKLKEGVDEATLLKISDEFDAKFVKKQKGIIRRQLLRTKHGGYADLVFFESKSDADRVAEAEANSAECMEFFSIMQMPDANVPDMGVLSFEHIKTYD